MNFKFFLTVICAIGAISTIHGYHILCISSIPTSSQNLLGKGMVNALLKANHEVTWVTAFPPKTTRKGLHVIDVSAVISPVSENVKNTNYKISMSFLREFITNNSLAVIGIPAFQEALVKNNYDAVISVALPPDVSAGFAAIQQAPWLLLSSVVLQPFTEVLVDEVKTLATIPMCFNDFPIPMNFVQRLLNTAMYAIMTFDYCYYKKAKYLSYLFKKRPVSQSKLISHYVELAIESKGAYHLRSKANLYPFYQRWMLDQIALILFTLVIVLKLASFILRLVIRIVSVKKETTVKFKTN